MKIELKLARKVDVSDVIRRSPVVNMPNAEKILRSSLERSETKYTLLIDGEIACVWGLIPPTLMSDTAYVWMLTTDLMDQHPFILVRKSQIVMQDMLKRYARIEGHVDAGQDRSIRWLKWLGFKMGALEQGHLIRFELRSA